MAFNKQMKYLLRYSVFEGTYDYTVRYTKLTKKQFQELYDENCTFHKKIITDKENMLFRGQDPPLEKYWYVDPTKSYRKSIENENIHVHILTESFKWKRYPRYAYAVIGTTEKSQAGSYGSRYEIIPYDNSLIALCPSSTIWDSFGGFSEYAKIRMTTNFLDNFNVDTQESWSTIQEDIIENFSDIKSNIKEIQKTIVAEKYNNIYSLNDENPFAFCFLIYMQSKKLLTHYEVSDINQEHIIDEIYIGKFTANDIIKYIDKNFSPKLNNFTVQKYNLNFELGSDSGRQMWTEGPTLLRLIE
jgi:hypothetical protein